MDEADEGVSVSGFNQPGDLTGYNPFSDDAALVAATAAFGASQDHDRLARFGALVGSTEMQRLARDANGHPPAHFPFDRNGNCIDHIDFHPAWNRLMQIARGAMIHAAPWVTPGPGAHVARAAMAYLLNQGENGVCCPTTMTFASFAPLQHAPDMWAHFAPLILSPHHDPRPLPAEKKRGLTVGMAMTEKQGGSDLRQTTTTGRRHDATTWHLNGHKWFFSVPQSDLFLTLARTDGGVSCFLARGWLDDGRRNGLVIRRLKDKCGNRSNASSEVVFHDLEAEMVGQEGQGIRILIGMAHLTRFDCAISSAAIMRQALTQAIHHCRHRHAFQHRLIDQPLMQNVLTDLALDAEAFMWAGMRLAQMLDRPDDPSEKLLGRIAIPMMKYLACKRAPAFVAEALECHGGNGYVEDHPMARLYREAPLNGIWEGSGNVICLDVLRSLAKSPEATDAWLVELRSVSGANRSFDQALTALTDRLRDPNDMEYSARHIVARMARLLQASLLIRHAPEPVAAGFCETRLGPDQGEDYGRLLSRRGVQDILDRASVGGLT